MNKIATFLMLTLSLGIPASGGAQGSSPPEPVGMMYKVKLNVVAREQLKADIYRNMIEAFKSRPEVQLVQENPDWTIEVVTLTLQDDEGNPTAVGLSVIVLEHGPQMNMLLTLAKAWRYVISAGLLQKDQPLEVGMRELLISIDGLPKTDPLTVVSQHRMCLIPVQKLGQACRDTVLNFSERFLDAQDLTEQTQLSKGSSVSGSAGG